MSGSEQSALGPVADPALHGSSDGLHWREWTAEMAGTGLLMFAIVTGWYWCVVAGGPWATPAVRVPVVAAIVSAFVIAIAYSPLGRRSGAHLNPAVTVALWLQGSVSGSDLIGYTVSQSIGGMTGFALSIVWGPRIAQPGIQWAQIAPDPGPPVAVPALIEAAATAVQLAVLFALLRRSRWSRWAGAVAAGLLGIAIAALAGTTGAGFSPVRGLGPDFLAHAYPSGWIYLAGPLVGAAAAALIARRRPALKTAKLAHDPTVECFMHCELRHRSRAPKPDASLPSDSS